MSLNLKHVKYDCTKSEKRMAYGYNACNNYQIISQRAKKTVMAVHLQRGRKHTGVRGKSWDMEKEDLVPIPDLILGKAI